VSGTTRPGACQKHIAEQQASGATRSPQTAASRSLQTWTWTVGSRRRGSLRTHDEHDVPADHFTQTWHMDHPSGPGRVVPRQRVDEGQMRRWRSALEPTAASVPPSRRTATGRSRSWAAGRGARHTGRRHAPPRGSATATSRDLPRATTRASTRRRPFRRDGSRAPSPRASPPVGERVPGRCWSRSRRMRRRRTAGTEPDARMVFPRRPRGRSAPRRPDRHAAYRAPAAGEGVGEVARTTTDIQDCRACAKGHHRCTSRTESRASRE
jgi:hypothetical protein